LAIAHKVLPFSVNLAADAPSQPDGAHGFIGASTIGACYACDGHRDAGGCSINRAQCHGASNGLADSTFGSDDFRTDTQ
jgi:hypothetical protein